MINTVPLFFNLEARTTYVAIMIINKLIFSNPSVRNWGGRYFDKRLILPVDKGNSGR